MKRRELERRLRIAGCYLKREGKSHSLWINPKTGVIEAVPLFRWRCIAAGELGRWEKDR